MTDNVRYLVKDENTLGFVYDEQSKALWPLARIHHAVTGLGRSWQEGLVVFDEDQARPATLDDFERFRVCSKGYLEQTGTAEQRSNPAWGMF